METATQPASDREWVGDFCSDTLPMKKAWDCRPPSASTVGHNIAPSLVQHQRPAVMYAPDATSPTGQASPWDNIMSYGECRSKITPQQSARALCYLDQVTRLKP